MKVGDVWTLIYGNLSHKNLQKLVLKKVQLGWEKI